MAFEVMLVPEIAAAFFAAVGFYMVVSDVVDCSFHIVKTNVIALLAFVACNTVDFYYMKFGQFYTAVVNY